MPTQTPPAALPSRYPRYTKAYAIDQLADVDALREVAHRMYAAVLAAQWQAAHIRGAWTGDCTPCAQALDAGESLHACAAWQQHDEAIAAGFGSV